MKIIRRAILSRTLIGLMSLGLAVGALAETTADERKLQPFIDCIRTRGADPVEFVLESLEEHDLLIFDDAIHNAVEPFEFYQQLVRDPAFSATVKYIFVELSPINYQPELDAYFAASPEDPSLLYPVFQNTTDTGLAYKTYFDLMRTIHEVNEGMSPDDRITVIATSHPGAWPQIENADDLEIDRSVYLYRDFLMYKYVLDGLDYFDSGRKGVFLTNTRHAYTGIRKSDGSLHWNTGTFFREWHPGKTSSIRIHNASLHLVKKDMDGSSTREPGRTLTWVRMGDGIWDSAFAATDNKPVAIPLVGSAFGEHPYIGNHMLNVLPKQTMADAYDALIFLAPLETLRKTAWHGELFTAEFKDELARRYRIMHPPEKLAKRLARNEVDTLAEYIELIAESEPETSLPQVAHLGSVDAWRGKP